MKRTLIHDLEVNETEQELQMSILVRCIRLLIADIRDDYRKGQHRRRLVQRALLTVVVDLSKRLGRRPSLA